MKSAPIVSIIMATYNRAHFIVETLLSVQKQTYKNWECLIIDDGGTDNTKEVIQPILKLDSRFIFMKRPKSYRKGLPGCRNFGLDSAKGDYFIFFDDDDIVHPLNLELCVNELKDNPNLFYCNYVRKTFENSFHYKFNFETNFERKRLDGKKILLDVIANSFPINSCSVLWRKEVFEAHIFQEELMYAEEWELYSRILSEGFNGIFIDKVLFFGRKHPKSNTGEFWNKNLIRIESKYKAIKLIVTNLKSKELLSEKLYNYFIGLAISYRNFELFKFVLANKELDVLLKIKLNLKFYLFPLWRKYKQLIKKI